jgi:AraC-like DNA-binding protein
MLQVYQSALFAVFSFVLYFRHGNYSKKYLGWFMILSAAFGIYRGAYTPGFYHWFWYLFPIGIPLFLSFFPTFYFYIKSLIIREYHFSRKEYRHLWPAIILFSLSLPYYVISGEKRESFFSQGTGLLESQWLTYLKYTYYFFIYGYFNFQVVLYSIKIARLYKIHKTNLESSFSFKNSIQLSWVIILTVMIVVFLILLDLSYLLGKTRHDYYHIWINLIMLLIILLFGIFGILQRDIYPHHELAFIEPEEEVKPVSVIIESGKADQETVDIVIMQHGTKINPEVVSGDDDDSSRVKKYAGSGLTEQQKKVLKKTLEKLMKEKLFLNEKLTIDDMADKMETNSKYLSQVINESHNQNFYTYINAFRIQEAQKLLKDKYHQKYSIQGIARLAGFSSKSSFNEAFRRVTGMTPSEYQEKK